MKKKLLCLCLLSLLSLGLLAACGKKKTEDNPNMNSENYLSGTYYALMSVEDYGDIYLELYADLAPATVTNFVNLVNDKFYDGLTFHRIIENFMMQGGDPKGNGSGGSKYTVPGEFFNNEFDNPISHVRGAISMARTPDDYNSASSQFFIMHEDNAGLDGDYAAFGQVVGGMKIIDAICTGVSVEDDNGTVLKENQPVITFIRMIDENEVITDKIEVTVEEIDLPDPTASISLIQIDTPEGLLLEDTWNIDEDGAMFLLTSDQDLLSLALYKTDLSEGVPYDVKNPLAYSSNIGASTFISVKVTATTDKNGWPDMLLVAEEHNGALGKYLLNVDAYGSIYLLPVSN